MAIKASFSPSARLLSEFGDSADDTITTSRNAAGQILVNGGAVSIDGGQPTVANTTVIWPAPGSEDTELGVILEPEVVYGTQTLCTRVQA